MSHALSSVASYLTSLWKPEYSETWSTFSRQSDPVRLAITQSATRALNQQISDLLPGCTLCQATLRETKQGELSLHSEAGETIVFSDEKTMNQWLADKATVDVWQIEDQRPGRSGVSYKLQRVNAHGYDTFETRDELFDQLREDYGVFWKLEDQGKNQTSYIYYKPGIFGKHYVDVNHEDLIFVANSLKLEGSSLPTSTSHASGRTSWGKGIAACVLGGLLMSAGRSWSQSFNQNSVSVALGPSAFKAASTFAAIAAVSMQEGGALPGALVAGMMFLAEPVKGQSLCPQLAGSYNTPGWALGFALSNNYAYMADHSGGFQIIDVSNVVNPTLAGSYNTPSWAYDVALSGNYSYVVDRDFGLQIIDVSNVANPTLAGSYDTPGWAVGIAVSGTYAYVADYSGGGLQIIDVSNVTNPTLAGFYNTPGNAWSVALSGNYAYMADWGFGLQIIDVSNVTNPTFAGSYDTPGNARGVAVSGTYVYLADESYGLQIIDVSNVTNPTLAGSYDTPGWAIGIAVSGIYAYVADLGFGLQVIDVSNVTNPTLAGSYNTPGNAWEVVLFGSYAFIGDYAAGLQIIDVGTPCPTSSSSITPSSSTISTLTSSSITTGPVKGQSLCPQIVGNYDTPDTARSVTILGSYAYVADHSSGLLIINVSNVTNPTLVGVYNTPGHAYDVVISGSYAYVADRAFGLQIIDVSNVSNLTRLGWVITPGLAHGVALSGNYAYVADWGSGLQIIDVSNVTNPIIVGQYIPPGTSLRLTISGNYAYVAASSGGLQIIDVSNVTNPTRISWCVNPGSTQHVILSGNYAYVAGYDFGLQIIDISNITNPTYVGGYDTPGLAVGVALSGNYAYVADWNFGLQIIDVRNVTNPIRISDGYDTPGTARHVVLSGNYAFVADMGSGLQIIDISVPCLTSSSGSSITPSNFTTSFRTSSSSFSTSSSSTTGSTGSSDLTNPAASSMNNPSSTSSTTELSTTKFTTMEASRSTVSSGPPWLWLGLLGGGLCICLIGGTAFILHRRRRSSNNTTSLIERGSETHSSFELEPVKERSHTKIGGAYYQLSKISKEEAREIYRQTDHLIVFHDDKKKIKYVLGRGNFGAIKVAQRIEDHTYVASKRVKGEKNIRSSEAEANLQREASGENILPIYNTIKLEKALYHFMPLAGLGDGSVIQEQLSTLKLPHLAIEILKFVTKDLLTGLNTLHRRGTYHLDIKPDNLVFTKDGTGYITDFGCARASSTPQIPSDAIGDNRYFSPDRLQARREKTTFDGEKADLWAAGLTLLQIMKNMDPFQLFEMPGHLAVRVERCGPDFFQERLQRFEELQKVREGTIWWVIKGLLDPHPRARITAQKALEAPCFKGVNKTFQARMFEDMKREQVAQTTQVKKEEVDLSNYGGIAQAAMMREMREIYDSQQQQQYYDMEGYGSMPTAEKGAERYQAPPENPAASDYF
ncbi:MAG: Serine/threonine-protein kinase PknH [Chlamydiae bacterium]|nr:Serine/threonine-protein kinase PknH [Chlamydiota bacterium]